MTEAVSYSIKLPARTLRAVPASSNDKKPQWIVGTTSLREENEVRCLLLWCGLLTDWGGALPAVQVPHPWGVVQQIDTVQYKTVADICAVRGKTAAEPSAA